MAGALDPLTAWSDQFYDARSLWADPQFLTDYNANRNLNDVGVVVLGVPVPRAVATPTPVLALSSVDAELTARRTLEIAGYGITNRAGTGDNTHLYLAEVPFISRTDYEVTAGDPGGADTCYGDSGGPLTVDTADGARLVGATSRGAGPARACDSGTVFTLVPAYAAKIAQATGVDPTGPSSRLPGTDAGVTSLSDAGLLPAPGDVSVAGHLGGDGGAMVGMERVGSPRGLGGPALITGGCEAAGGGSAPTAPIVSAMLVALVAVRPRRRRGAGRHRRRTTGGA